MSLTEESRNPGIVPPQYLLSGSAYAVGGLITRRQGTDTFAYAPVQGTSVVPAVGGYSQSKLPKGSAGDFVTFDGVETETEGRYDVRHKTDQCFVRSRASVSGLTVVDRFRAPFVQASLRMQYEREGTEPRITLEGTTFGGAMTLDDETIVVHMDTYLASLTTLSSLEEAWKKDQNYRQRFRHGPRNGGNQGPPRLSKSEYLMLPIVDSIRIYNSRDPNKPTKAKALGNTVSLKGFGTIYFGEMLIRAESRRLSMMRFELGCQNEGRLSICGTESMGEFCPP